MNPGIEPALPETPLPEPVQGVPGATDDWWSTVQEDIRQSEYHVTWQEHTYLEGLEAAYQAPNRAHNLRTTFTVHRRRDQPNRRRPGTGDALSLAHPPTLPGRERAGAAGRTAG